MRLAANLCGNNATVSWSNLLFDRDVAFEYEKPLYAPDGSFYLPDFTITWRGERFFWEHLGLLVRDEYRRKWETKRKNTATAVLLVGRQCCVSNSAIARYEARFCRSSAMTSLAGIRSWNFSGRRGVNSATACRTLAGSNEVIRGSVVDVDGKLRCRRNSHAKAMQRRWPGRG